MAMPQVLPAPPVAHSVRPNPARVRQLMTYGDRLFRGKNLKKASERYGQVLRLNPTSASPRVRLAQVALVRGQFTEAADFLRQAQAADPRWIDHADDVEGLYSEPRDFHEQIAKLESHLQTRPNDRDAWLVLGAQWFLSGRTEQAHAIFLRLTDRQPDAILSALLRASTPVDLPQPQAEDPEP